MSFTCKVIMQFKEGMITEKVMDLLKDPNEGIEKTRQFPGFESIELYTDKEDKNQLIIWEKWQSEAAFDSYFAMRQETGFFDKIGDWFAAPPKVCKLDPIKL